MQLIRGPAGLTKQAPCAATVGNFDGVHLGHQAIIKSLVASARSRDLPAVVVVFEPHPREYFQGDAAPARIYTLRDKLAALESLGVDEVVCLRFDADFAAQSPETFVRELLVRKLDVRYLVVGDDFRFGNQRRGDFALLKALGKDHFETRSTASICARGERVSSTHIRELLAAADFESAARLLGRPFELSGRVVHGDKRGRELGFPTLNIPLRRQVSPLHGVYRVRVCLEGESLPGIANIGRRPTLFGADWRLEVHVLGMDRDCYGSRVSVRPLEKIRDEKKFTSAEALRAQIAEDTRLAMTLFENDTESAGASAINERL